MARPALLFLSHRVPYPPDKGERIRAFHQMCHLARTVDVHLACLADEPVAPESLEVLRRLCARVAVVPLGAGRWVAATASLLAGRSASEGAFHSARLASTVRAWACDTTFAASLSTASSLVRYQRLPALRDIPAVVDLVDVDSQKWLDYAAASRGPRAWLYRTEGRRVRRVESNLLGWARAVVVISEIEAELYRSFTPDADVRVVPNGVDYDRVRPPVGDRIGDGCVFVGALDYRPNVDAVEWFSREVWPAVRERHPAAVFRLVGRRPTPGVTRLGRLPGVVVVGQVPDVRPHIAASAVSVAPLRIARGQQNKVAEALAMYRPVVASPQAVQGLPNRSEVPALVASSPNEWVEQVVGLLDDREFCRRLGQEGRDYAERNLSWDRCLAPLDELLGLVDSPAHLVEESRG